MSRDHRKLEAFSLADSLAMAVYRETTRFPLRERYGLQSQLRRAAVSTATNIVEGSARSSEADYLRFLDIAFSSACEAAYLSDLSARLGFIDRAVATPLIELANKTAAKTAALRAGVLSSRQRR